jgi:Holliday junction resolvasome RuvABC endonuclease subunit
LATYEQVASIEGASLRAPEGQPDDLADALALANLARGLGARAVSMGGY